MYPYLTAAVPYLAMEIERQTKLANNHKYIHIALKRFTKKRGCLVVGTTNAWGSNLCGMPRMQSPNV